MAQPAPGCNGTTYEILTEGNGTAITKGCTATVHALGVVKESGKKFWSTEDPGQSAFSYRAGVGKVIKGWDQGCLGMKVGEQRKLTIPGDEGYGGAGAVNSGGGGGGMAISVTHGGAGGSGIVIIRYAN